MRFANTVNNCADFKDLPRIDVVIASPFDVYSGNIFTIVQNDSVVFSA